MQISVQILNGLQNIVRVQDIFHELRLVACSSSELRPYQTTNLFASNRGQATSTYTATSVPPVEFELAIFNVRAIKGKKFVHNLFFSVMLIIITRKPLLSLIHLLQRFDQLLR
jgi:hypothetical protein